MSKTAIEQLIQRLGDKKIQLKKEMNLPPNLGNEKQTLLYMSEIMGIEYSINEAKSMLPIEKQNIVDAAADAFLGSRPEGDAKQIGENYFKNTFKK